ncbi:MAG: zinc ribbon domain-containing protein [Muribaculaceae bacterium]|nr:zinc ribbon domain-containing protein [Muribaculaceae bacterium]
MEKVQQNKQVKYKAEQVSRVQTIAEQQPAEATAEYHCHNCGARVGSGILFCEECGARLGTGSCRHCHATVEPGLALCKECGRPLSADKCTFCGGKIPEGMRFCPECGNPHDGIPCPKCGARSFRSFCHRCNEPLNEMAREEIKRAQSDPRFQRAMQIAERLAELEQKIRETGTDIPASTDILTAPSQLDDSTRQKLNRYQSLLSSIGAVPDISSHTVHEEHTSKPQVEKPQACTVTDNNEAIMTEYRRLAEEMQEELDAMMPEPKSTPEQKRNFFCARKVTLTVTGKETLQAPVAWICNLCGCRHSQPSECAQPELGGKWVYKSITVETTSFKSSTIYV